VVMGVVIVDPDIELNSIQYRCEPRFKSKVSRETVTVQVMRALQSLRELT